MVTVSIIEDDRNFRERLESIINATEEFRVVYTYASAEEAFPHMKEFPPDLAVVDIKLPGQSGVDLIAAIHSAIPGTQCLVCSFYDDDEYVFSALKNGASGYLLKESRPEELIASLKELRSGGAPMSRYIAKKVIAFFQGLKTPQQLPELTARENEILQLVAKGLLVKEIAAHLVLSHHTVAKHLRNIYGKLHVTNRVEAVNRLNLPTGQAGQPGS
jgi:DNA-binding NarL/FixJ family response regulator